MTLRKTVAMIIALTMLSGVLLCFSGCGKSAGQYEPTTSEFGGLVAIGYEKEFIEGTAFDQYILYDPETLVMYSAIKYLGDAMSVTVLYNADGTPKLYDPENN